MSEKNCKLGMYDLPRILRLLETLTLGQVGRQCGFVGSSANNRLQAFLTRHGVDPEPYRRGKHLKALPSENKPLPAPVMRFETVTSKDHLGRKIEKRIPVPESIGTDPETGARLVKYPAGYAQGYYPPKNVRCRI